MTILEKLVAIQSDLKAPKGQTNTFGKYKYRSCEDILESVKPLLKQHGLVLTLVDDVVNIGTRFYVKATATVSMNTVGTGEAGSIQTTAFAREEETKKGMDGAQVTGAASSYARKYALNGLFCIDDTKDADTMDNSREAPRKATATPARSPAPAEPASTQEQQDAIKELVRELGMDLEKDILKKAGWRWPLTASQADAALKRLQQRKKDLAVELDSKSAAA